MAISGNASYISTTEEFLEHWEAANTALPPTGPIVFPGAPLGFPSEVNLSTLNALFTDLTLQIADVQSKSNGLALARGDLQIKQRALIDQVGQFNDKVRGNLSGTMWVNALPLAPSEGDAQSRFCDPLDDAVDLWLRINTTAALGVGKLLVLREGTTQAQFAAAVATLKSVWRGVKSADLDLKLARGQRNAIQDRIYPILKQYRVVLPTFFAPGSALVTSLPRLTPEPGSTPQPAVLSWAWNAGTNKADLSAAIPAQAGLKKIRLLYSPGTTWSEEDAGVVQSLSLVGVNVAQPVVFHTDFALSSPGSMGLFRVLVVNDTDNESLSNLVTVVRP